MRARILLGCLVVVAGCAEHRAARVATPKGAAAAPVVVAEAVREAPPNDYLRVGFLAAGTEVTSIARPGALRGFMTATVLYSPPLTLEVYPTYLSLVNDDSKVLVAMRCKPPDPQKVDAVLATWPNVFAAVVRDVVLAPNECDSSPPDPDKQMACFARGFSNQGETAVPTALARTFGYAGKLYDSEHTALAKGCRQTTGSIQRLRGRGIP